MIIADLPKDEDLRLHDLSSYEIMYTQSEEDFDDLVELASQICKCPISLITLLDKDRQWFKAKNGLEGVGTSRDLAFCAHAILQDNVMVVEDATKDVRFFDNPLVTGEENIRFYAGAPIVSPAGHKLGTICIIDHKPKKLNSKEERALTLLSNQVSKLLDLRRKNVLIRDRAKEIITLKSKVINRVVQEQEDDRKSMACNLHEDFAQRIASGLLYLKMAEENKDKRLSFVETAKEQLQDVLTNIRDLSYRISPPNIDWQSTGELVEEFLKKISPTFSFRINLQVNDAEALNAADNTLAAVRIIEQWLKILSHKNEISHVTIRVQTTHQFELSIEDNAAISELQLRETEIFGSGIYDRVHSLDGSIDLSVPSAGQNMIKIILPQAKKLAEADLLNT